MNKIKIVLFTLIILSLIMVGCENEVKQTEKNIDVTLPNNTLSKQEIADGWELLFDGKTTNGWHKFNDRKINGGWIVENEELVALGKGADIGGDIVSDKEYKNFDLKVEWKISPEGNSGIFYHVKEGKEYKALYATGPEYQLIDDVGFPSKLADWQKAAANYAMHLTNHKKRLKPVGKWNTSRIVVQDSLVMHYLNGEKVIQFKQWTPDWERRKAEGKWKNTKDYGRMTSGKIGLQDHGNKIWFRNIKIKSLK